MRSLMPDIHSSLGVPTGNVGVHFGLAVIAQLEQANCFALVFGGLLEVISHPAVRLRQRFGHHVFSLSFHVVGDSGHVQSLGSATELVCALANIQSGHPLEK